MKFFKSVITLVFILGLIAGTPLYASSVSSDKVLAVDNLVAAGKDTFYRIAIKNDDNKIHKYLLSYGTLQKEFKADFLLDGKVIRELKIKEGKSLVVGLHVSVPQSIASGTNVFSVEAKRDDGQNYKLPISLTVNRDYSLAIINQINGLNIINGQSVNFEIAVSNTGSKSMDNIGLKVDLPYKWMVQSVNPEKLSLKAGENGLLKVQISVPPTQVSGNNKIKVSAISDNINSPQILIPVTVQSNPNYLYWVIGLLVVAGISTILYFRKHGRR